MSLPRFFAPEIKASGPCLLPPEEAHHLRSVLRLKAGERIGLINGRGEAWEAKILEVEKNRVLVIPEDLHHKEPSPEFHLELLLPLLKGGRTEFLVEKATELGVTEIIPFFSRYTVVKPGQKIKARLQRRALQALKQSGRLWLPEIRAPQELVESLAGVKASYRYFAWEKGGRPVAETFSALSPFPKGLALAVGPEGGFSEEEIELFEKFGFEPLDLGPYILRAETAVLFLLSVWRYHILKSQLPPSKAR